MEMYEDEKPVISTIQVWKLNDLFKDIKSVCVISHGWYSNRTLCVVASAHQDEDFPRNIKGYTPSCVLQSDVKYYYISCFRYKTPTVGTVIPEDKYDYIEILENITEGSPWPFYKAKFKKSIL